MTLVRQALMANMRSSFEHLITVPVGPSRMRNSRSCRSVKGSEASQINLKLQYFRTPSPSGPSVVPLLTGCANNFIRRPTGSSSSMAISKPLALMTSWISIARLSSPGVKFMGRGLLGVSTRLVHSVSKMVRRLYLLQELLTLDYGLGLEPLEVVFFVGRMLIYNEQIIVPALFALVFP